MTIGERFTVDELLELVRRAAPFETLTREVLEGVLGMLAGAYPSDEFAELRPRIVWDRLTDTVEGRRDARVVAVTSGGTIPDRGLFPVFLEGEPGTTGRRVGELDEEMVYELRAGMHGDVVILGASSWRVAEISPNRVTVTPAPGVPGKLPFWKGDTVGRPIELGRAMGAFTREAEADLERGPMRPRGGIGAPARDHDLDPLAAENLLAYLEDERGATGRPADGPPDRRRALPRRARGLAPRRPDAVRRPRPRPVDDGARGPARGPARVRGPDDLVRRRDRDPAARGRVQRGRRRGAAVPRSRGGRGPGGRPGRPVEPVRQPLPGERRSRAAAAAAPPGHADPALAAAPAVRGPPGRGLALRELPDPRRDLPRVPRRRVRPAGAARDPRRRRRREIAVHAVETPKASPFASSLLFDYIAPYMYEGDAPLAERRAQALTLDRDLLRELLGQEELRELLDAEALADLELSLQALVDERHADDRRPGPRPAAAAGRPDDRRGRRPDGGRPARGLPPPRGAGRLAAGGPREDRRRGALDRDGGRRPLPRRGRGGGATRRAAGVPRPRGGRAGRPARALCAHPRAVPGRRPARAGACRRAWSRTRSTGWSPRAASCPGSSARAAPSASSAIRRSSACSGDGRSRSCAGRSSRSIP